MDFEFDNEIDSWLHNAAQKTAFADENTAAEHLSADDLAAFAENVLPEKSRLLYAEHLTECTRCREILSNLILLQEAEQEETAAEIVSTKTLAPATSNSWFKNLFILPKLGYAMAALAVLLIGTYAFVAIRQNQSQQETSVAAVQTDQIEKQAAKKTLSVPAQTIQKEEEKPEIIQEPSPSPTENDLASTEPQPAPSEDLKNLPPGYRGIKNLNSGNKPVAQEQQLARNEIREQPAPNSNNSKAVLVPQAKPATPIIVAENDKINKAKAELKASTTGDVETQTNDARVASGNLTTSSAIADAIQAPRSAATATDVPSGKRASAAPGGTETRVFGGKTFRRQNGVWVDASYASQNTTIVVRDSGEYKKLDAGLRAVGDGLSGEIIVLWQGKAYKIR